MCVLFYEGFTSPEVVQVSNNSSGPGNTPRRRSADTAMSSRRKLSASKEPKLNVEALNELNKNNKAGNDSKSTSSSTAKDLPKTATTTKTDKSTFKTEIPSVEISNSSNNFTMETKIDKSSQRAPSPLDRISSRSFSMTRQEAVSDIRRSRGLLNGEPKVNNNDKSMTTAKPPLVASKEPVVTSKPPTTKSHDHNRDSKSNSFKNTGVDEHPAVANIKDAAKEQSAASPSSRRISQYRLLSETEALHIFHPTRRSANPKSGEFGDFTTEQNDDDSRTNSPAPPSKSPVLDRNTSTSLKRGSKLVVNATTEETATQPQPTPKSPVLSVTGVKRPGVVESKTKKMLALLGKEASVDIDRPTDIPRTSPVSINAM